MYQVPSQGDHDFQLSGQPGGSRVIHPRPAYNIPPQMPPHYYPIYPSMPQGPYMNVPRPYPIPVPEMVYRPRPSATMAQFAASQVIPVIRKYIAKHKQADTIPEEDEDDSKTPKLKYSHKIAERKRRKDMNDTFEELKSLLPGRSLRMSKWEILATAAEHIDTLRESRNKLLLERETLHRELSLPVVDLVRLKTTKY